MTSMLFCLSSNSAQTEDIEERLRALAEQNALLQRQITAQREIIDSLREKVSALEAGPSTPVRATDASNALPELESPSLNPIATASQVHLGGQMAAAFFNTGREGMFPNGEFRADEARLFLDVRAAEDVFGFIELNVITREDDEEGVHLGEAYIDFEQVLKWKGLDSLINLRIGRFYIPFGEEYQVRYPMDNPLILHSLSDLWGVDEGIEAYGSYGKVSYAMAVQNGGHPALRDFTSDKSIAGRIAYDPWNWLHLSASGMRTGDLEATDDFLSEMWFGNAFIRSLGGRTSTSRFGAELFEGDVELRFDRGHLKFAGGAILYDDNDRVADNSRDVYYYYGEGLFRFTKKFYGATRFSQILAKDGFPVLGNGTWPQYFMQELTDHLWRLSLGLGFAPNPNLVFKVEYALERGETVAGRKRGREDFVGAQAALRF